MIKVAEQAWKASWSPDGRFIVFGKPPPAGGLEVLELDGGGRRLLSKFGKEPAWSPDGRYIAFVAEEMIDGFNSDVIWLVTPTASAPQKLRTGSMPTWSVDGKVLYFYLLHTNLVWAVAVDSRPVEARVFCSTPQQTYRAVSPDGKQVAFSNRDALVVVDPGTDRELYKWEFPEPLHGVIPTWSPNADRIAFSGFSNRVGGVWVVDIPTGTIASLIDGPFMMPAWSPDGRRLAFDMRVGNARDLWMADEELIEKLLLEVQQR